MLALRRPQCVCFRGAANTHSMCRLIALIMSTRACIGTSRPSAAPIRQPIAVCHSSISCSAFGRLVMQSPASRRVSSSRPPGSRIGSSKGRAQAAAGLDRAISYLPSGMCCMLNWRSFPPLRLPHSPSRLLCFPEPLTEFVQFGDLNKEIGRITGEN